MAVAARLFLTITLSAAGLTGAQAQDHTLLLDSASSFDLERVYAARGGSNVWEELDVTGLLPIGKIIVAGGSGEVQLPQTSQGCVYDLRFDMDSDVTFHDWGVNLCAASAYTLVDMFE